MRRTKETDAQIAHTSSQRMTETHKDVLENLYEALDALIEDIASSLKWEGKDDERKRAVWVIKGHIQEMDDFWEDRGDGSLYDYAPSEEQKKFARLVLTALLHDIKDFLVQPGLGESLPSDEEMDDFDEK